MVGITRTQKISIFSRTWFGKVNKMPAGENPVLYVQVIHVHVTQGKQGQISCISAIFLAETKLCLSLHFVFSLKRNLSRSFQSVTTKNCKEVLAVRTSYLKEVLALLTCKRKEVLAVSRTQAQATRNQPQEELLLADTKRSSCACIIFGLYCILAHVVVS